MTPAARLQAAIELLAVIDRGEAPADGCVSEYFRARRYAGGGDRRAITERVYGILRHRGWLHWCLGDDAGRTARELVLADLVLSDGLAPDQLSSLCSGEGHAPAALSPDEAALSRTLSAPAGPPPDWVIGNFPPWLEDQLRRRFADALVAETTAFEARASVDFRVNRLRLDREAARSRLAAEGIETTPGDLSLLCLRLSERKDLRGAALFREGAIEPQDEASQLAALLVEAAPGQQVVDFCAGAGGKTLALAAEMANRGQIYALDLSARRLQQLAPRLQRAGVRNVQSRVLNRKAQAWLDSLAGRMDRVLVDAPCSGSGAWRRNPETRWRLEAGRLEHLVATQQDLLRQAAGLVRPGGRLIYAVCSLLPAESEDVVETFLGNAPDFRPLPIGEVWQRALPQSVCPVPADQTYLVLTPLRHNTDGFFIAVLERAVAELAPGNQTLASHPAAAV